MVSGYGAFRSAYIFSTTGPRICARYIGLAPLTLRGNVGGRAAFVYVQRPFSFRPIDPDVLPPQRGGSPGGFGHVGRSQSAARASEGQLIKIGN